MFRREQTAAGRGAIGALRIVEETPVRSYRIDPKSYWLKKNGSPFQPLPDNWVGGFVTAKAAKALFEGSGQDLEAIFSQVKARSGRPAAAALKTKVRLQASSDWKRLKAPQVLGMLRGSDPRLRDEVVILTGHLDGRGIDPAAPSGGDNIRNATIDNAAGIATLLEVARSFSGAARPKRSILFFANTAEEKWLIGSSYYANNPTVPARRISSVANIDTPLITVDFRDVIAFGAEHSTLGPLAERVIKDAGLSATVDPMPDQGLFVRTDHYSFVEKGIPSIHLQVGFANGGEEQWKRYFGSHYHGVSDDMNQKIFWSAGARFADLHYRLVRTLADVDANPKWRRGSILGDLFAGKQPKAQQLK
jgi:Zn-dependent M28 family amino/carboxypeptidase